MSKEGDSYILYNNFVIKNYFYSHPSKATTVFMTVEILL